MRTSFKSPVSTVISTPIPTATSTPQEIANPKEVSNPIEQATDKSLPSLPALAQWSSWMNSVNIDCDKKDVVLADLVNWVNHSCGVLAITLSIPGCLVVGQLIGAVEFFTLMEQEAKPEQASDQTTGNCHNTQSLPAYLAETIQELRANFAEDHGNGEDRVHEMPHYIHLKNARLINGGASFPAEGGVLWRGRLGEIVGFNLGAIA